MKTAGVREAKEHLSRLLREVRAGAEWVITERGVPIARLVPISSKQISFGERVRRLEQSGVLERAPMHPVPIPPPLRLKRGLARQFLEEDRGL